jgi:hypothetical protein
MSSTFRRIISKATIAIDDPRRIVSTAYELYDTRLRGKERVNVVDRDWDVLIILDGCRYDLFASVNTMDGELSPIRSVGSKTGEFLQQTFGSGAYPEIVYTSANPNISGLDAKFHDRKRLWESHWDDDLSVVPPGATTDAGMNAIEEHPNKRHIIHYMQPHIPFIGERGRELLSQADVADLDHGVKFWEQARQNSTLRQRFWDAYQENLEITLPHVQRLITETDGLAVVTSDHGNELGWFGVYGHPGGFYTPGLVIVPWFRTAYKERRAIESGEATSGPNAGADVTEKLESLGYLEGSDA